MKRLILAALLLSSACSSHPLIASQPVSRQTSATMNGSDLYTQFSGNIRKFLDCARVQKRPIIVAHRGGIAPGFPENSLAAFDHTLAHIPAILEMDVMASADGVDFLHHDPELTRTTMGTGPANAQQWNDIKSLKMRDNEFMPTPYSPVDLETALTHLQGRAFLMLDMKEPSDTKAVVRKVMAMGMDKSTIYIAYNHNQARAIKEANPDALIALGASSSEQIAAISKAGLDSSPYVALAGDIEKIDTLSAALAPVPHYLLVGTYYGQNPADARIAIEDNVPELDTAGAKGIQMLVTNRPFQTARYLSAHGQSFDPSLCAMPE